MGDALSETPQAHQNRTAAPDGQIIAGKLITSLLLIFFASLVILKKSVSNYTIIGIFVTLAFAAVFSYEDIVSMFRGQIDTTTPAAPENSVAMPPPPTVFKGPKDVEKAKTEQKQSIKKRLTQLDGGGKVLVIGNATENGVAEIISWNKGGTTLVVLPESVATNRFLESQTSVSPEHFVTVKYTSLNEDRLDAILESPSRWQLLTPSNIPEALINTRWDAIIVDTDPSKDEEQTIQAVYLAKILVSSGTDVYFLTAHHYTTQIAARAFFSFLT
jgi:hypothetical protein